MANRRPANTLIVVNQENMETGRVHYKKKLSEATFGIYILMT
jgi:hypothetical protein